MNDSTKLIPVPLLDLTRQNNLIEEALTTAFTRILKSGHYILGPEHDAFEQALSHFCEVSDALAISSGTDAILLALMSLDIQPGDEILCPSYTFFATAGCIARVGAIPVFVDACPLSFNMDVEDAARKITKKTKAILPVHLFGQAADMENIMALAKTYGLFVIEDAAQALGARFQGKSVGTFGEFGCFSFFPSKNLGCLGDGGALITRVEELAQKAKLLRNHGAQPKYFHSLIGGNFRLDTLQTAFLKIKLAHYGDYTEKRKAHAQYYTQRLSQLPSVAVNNTELAFSPEKSGIKLLLPATLPGRDVIWNQYTLRVIGNGKRDALKAFLTEHKIGCETYYPCTMDRQACFKEIGRGRETIQVAHQLQEEALSIPVFPEMTEKERDSVANAIEQFIQSY